MGRKINTGFLFTLSHSSFHSWPCPNTFQLVIYCRYEGGSAVKDPSGGNTTSFTAAGRTCVQEQGALSAKQIDQETKGVTDVFPSHRDVFLPTALCVSSAQAISNRSICPTPAAGLWKCILRASLQNSLYKPPVRNTTVQHQQMSVFSDRVSRCEILTWKFNGQTLHTYTCVCVWAVHNLLRAEWLCTGC